MSKVKETGLNCSLSVSNLPRVSNSQKLSQKPYDDSQDVLKTHYRTRVPLPSTFKHPG